MTIEEDISYDTEPVYRGGLMRLISLDSSREICQDSSHITNNNNTQVYCGEAS